MGNAKDTDSSASGVGVPRSRESLDALLRERPRAWEYLYFAGLLKSEVEGFEPKYLDSQARFAPQSAGRVDAAEIPSYLDHALDALKAVVGKLDTLVAPDVLQAAFGPPGQEGDPVRIRHLAQRWGTVYEELLDWAAAVRGVGAPSEYRHLLETVARFVDRPIERFRAFVDDLVRELDSIPDRVALGAPVTISLTLTLDFDDEVMAAYNLELAKLTER